MKRLRACAALALTLVAATTAHSQQPAPRGRLVLPVLPSVTITVLADNIAGPGPVQGEWGLSLFLQTDGQRILFDAGSGQVLLGNARALEVDLARANAIVVSHFHLDHTRGLEQALAATGRVPLYIHPDALLTRYWKEEGGVESMRLPFTRDQLTARVSKLVETRKATPIADGIWVTGQIPRVTDFEDTGIPNVFMDEQARVPDAILDDQALFFRVPEGVVIVLGCGHAGVVNTIRYVSELLGEERVYAVIGGTHLIAASPERMSRTIEALRRYDVQKIMLSHCTGLEAYARLTTAFPGRCSWPATSTRIQLGAAPPTT